MTQVMTSAIVSRKRCIHRWFESTAAEHSNAVAVVAGSSALTFEALNVRANQLARHLRVLGVKAGASVGIFTERRVEMIVGLLAVLKAGGCYVPLDPSYPAERLRYMLDDSDPRVILTCGSASSGGFDLAAGTPCLDLGQEEVHWQSLPSTNLDAKEVLENENHLAYLIYTSGSTGRPKAVAVEHRGLCDLVESEIAYLRVTSESRVLQAASFNFDASIFEMFMALCGGAALHFAPRDALLVGEALATAVQDNAITHLTLTPTVLKTLPESSPLPSLRTLVVAGEVLSAASARTWAKGRRLINAYGPTEATVCASWFECGDESAQDPPIGKPLPHVSLHVLDRVGRTLGTGEQGELYIGGSGVARGYLGRADLTAERFIPDPFAERPGARMFKTGDLGRRREDGNIEFLGREDGQVKIRGIRIELGEIEARLKAHPAIQQACVVVRGAADVDRQLVAYFVGKSKAMVDHAALREHAAASLPDYMVPGAYVAIEALPLTPNGKLDLSALPSPGDVTDGSVRYEAPSTPLEQAIAGFWSDVLGVARVGRTDHFFTLGGNSLRATMVISRIRASLSRDASIRQLFANPVLWAFVRDLEHASPPRAQLPQAEPTRELLVSSAQKRLWFVSQLEGASKPYHISIGPTSWMKPSGLRLRGILDTGSLRRALDTLMQRHDSLRETFVNVNGEPSPRIDAARSGFSLRVHDIRNSLEVASDLECLKHEEANTPFDLEQGPLVRGRLIRLADDEHVLLLTTHHIVCDGWSAERFLEELGVLYNAFSAGDEDPLPPLPLAYAEYASAQKRWLTGAAVREQTEYWRRTLGDAPTSLDLPTDRPRPPRQSFAGDLVEIVLDELLTADLKRLSSRRGTTLYATLLAGWAALLGRLSNQNDLIIGTPFAGRTRPDIEKLIGCFINTLALRIDLSGEPRVADLLAQVTKQTIEAQQYQDLPFERVVELANPPRDPARPPLFQVMFSWQNHALGKPSLAALSVSAEPAPDHSAKFDLELRLGEADGRIVGVLEFATALFDRTTIECHVEYFRTMLRAMADDEQQPVLQIELLSDIERQQLREEWKSADATATSNPRCVHSLFEEQVARTPQAIAVVHGERELTYRELDARGNRLAFALREQGVGPDCRVAICIERGIAMIVGILGVLKAGGTYVPLDPSYPVERLAHMVSDSSAEILLVDARTPGLLQEHLRVANGGPISVFDLSADLIGPDERSDRTPEPSRIRLTPQHLAYVIYTSGSTGKPKGVGLSHAALFDLVNWQIGSAGPQTTLQFAPLSFDVSFQEIFSALCSGATLVLFDNQLRQDPDRLFKLIQASNVQRLFLPYVALRMLAEALADTPDLGCSLQEIITAGEQLRITPAIAGLFTKLRNCRLHNHYGPTESHVVTAFDLPSDSARWPNLPPIGRGLPHARIYILDDHGMPVPRGVIGELHIGGPVLARGYLQQPALTAERFLPDPFSARGGARMYKTGDLARCRADGEIEFLGRNDLQVKIRGFRVELGEIEGCLAAHSAVASAVVEPRGDDSGNKRLVAYYVARRPVTGTELKTHVAGSLPDYMVPATYVELSQLPLTPSGKVNRRALPNPPSKASEGDTPAGHVEKRIAGIWAEILDIDRVERTENFFELGGHSLLATVLLIRIRSEFAVELALEDLFRAPVLTDFARVVIIKQLERLQKTAQS